MTQVSRYRLAEKIEVEIKELLAEIFSMLSSKQVVVSFLNDFLSASEKIVFAKRITIALMLKKNYDYDTIKRVLKVSQSTIAAVNLKLKYSGKGYHQILDKFLTEKKIENAFDRIENKLLEFLTLGRGKGTSVWWELKLKKQRQKSSII